MNSKKMITGIGAAAGMMLLILDGQTAFAAAAEGIELCIRTVIPSLFPFFVLSILLTGSLGGTDSRALRLLSSLFRIPQGSEVILLTGLLGGYPVGAQCVSFAYQNRQLNRSQAERMLYFCNNAGPAFIFGMMVFQFTSIWYGWLIWGILLLSALMVARTVPYGDNTPVTTAANRSISVQDTMNTALRAMGCVCGWVILFRVVIGFLRRWILWIFPNNIQLLITGLLELTNGCSMLSSISSTGVRMIFGCFMLSFGGICVLMQTASVVNGLNWKCCLYGKLLQSIYVIALAVLCQHLLPADQRWICPVPVEICAVLALFLPFFFRKRQKRYSVSTFAGV